MQFFPSRRITSRRRQQAGYMLLALMFFVAVLAITLTSAAREYAVEVKREKEIEMIHRGVEYSRAIKKYYKKFGRYPTRLEELENTNNMRFLRKRYKDPMMADGKWRLLYYGDLRIAQNASAGTSNAAGGGAGLGGGAAPPTSAFGSQPSGLGAQGSFGSQPSSFGSQPSAFGGQGTMGSQPSSFGQNPAGAQPSTFGQNAAGSQPSSLGQGTTTGGTQPSAGGTGGTTGDTSTATPSSSFGQPASQLGSSPGLSGQVFGGGPIVGVASRSEKAGLKEFNNKSHYNQWMFVYDPTQDRGNLIKGPYQPMQNLPGQTGMVPNVQGAQGIGPGGIGAQPNMQQQPQGQQPFQQQPR